MSMYLSDITLEARVCPTLGILVLVHPWVYGQTQRYSGCKRCSKERAGEVVRA